MRRLYRNAKALKAMLTVWLVLLYLPSLRLAEISTANGVIPVSLCYIFSVVFIPLLIFELPRLKIPPWYISFLYVFVLVWALIQAPAYGIGKGILHWAFGAYILLVLMNVGEYLSKKDIEDILQSGILAFIACHIVFMIINFGTVYEVAFEGRFAADLPSLTRGGRNLDATWLGLGCFLVRDKRLRVPCLLYSFAYAAIGVSRVGIIASGLCLIWVLAYDPVLGLRKRTAPYWCGAVALGLGGAYALGLLQRMINRVFYGFGEGASSFLAGREAIWGNALSMFKAHPFGVGTGNALPVMRLEFGFGSYEDIMHNVFLQMLMDEGFIGAIWFLALVGLFLYSERCRLNGWFRRPLSAFLLTYIVLSLVQFHGGEALMVFPLGCYLLEKGVGIRLFGRSEREAVADEK